MKKYASIFSAAFLFAPALVLAQEAAVKTITVVPDSLENILELANLVVAIAAAVFAVKLAALSQGGAMEKTWNMLALGAFFFALLEVANALEGFAILHLAGLDEILELAFVSIFALTFFNTRKQLLKQVMGK